MPGSRGEIHGKGAGGNFLGNRNAPCFDYATVVVTWCMYIFAKTQTQTKMVTFIVLNYSTIWLIFLKKTCPIKLIEAHL